MLANAVGHGLVDKAKSFFTVHNMIMLGIAGTGVILCIVGIALVSKHNKTNKEKKAHTAGAITLIIGLLVLLGEGVWYFHEWHAHHKSATGLHGKTSSVVQTVVNAGQHNAPAPNNPASAAAHRSGGLGMFRQGVAQAQAGSINIPGLMSNGSSAQANSAATAIAGAVPDSLIKEGAKAMDVPSWMANKATVQRAMAGMMSAPGGANYMKGLQPLVGLLKMVE